jgi:membrane protein required for colicin V production
MPSYLDLGVIVIVLVSAFLSMVRGFTREVLAIGSWVAAAAAAYFFYPLVLPYVIPYIHKDIIAQAVSAAVVFFATLIVVSIITVRLSDAILDSKIGALDRTLGFVFGAARGFLLAVVAFAIFGWLVTDKQQPEWVKNAKTRPILEETANRVIAILPEDATASIETWLKSKKPPTSGDEPPDEQLSVPATPTAAPPAPAATPAAPAKTTGSSPPTGATSADKQKLNDLIPLPPPVPGKPTILPTPKP